MTSEVVLCNRALAAIGTRSTISSITPSDGSEEANQCSLLYYPVRDQLLRSAHWDFARAQNYLAQLKSSQDTNSTCPVPWAYEYAYPSDCLKARYIQPYFYTAAPQGVPLTTAPIVPLQPSCYGSGNRPIRFVVATDKDQNNNDGTVILTNQPQAILIYTRLITNPNLFDSQFQEALVAALAAHLVPALSLNMDLMKTQIKIAEGIIAQARVTNGNEGPMSQDNTPDFIRARAGYADGGYGFGFYGWEAMSWPAGY